MARLPDELIFDILSRLPVKDLLRFKCVCKSWLTLIIDPRFIKTHLDRSIQSHKLSFIVNSKHHQLLHISVPSFFSKSPNDPITKLDLGLSVEKILGSCNGLLCFLSNISGLFWLLNPSTREMKNLPSLPYGLLIRHFRSTSHSPVWGFGLNSKTQEYKVVRIVFLSGVGTLVLVHTIGSKLWRSINQAPAYFIDSGTAQVLVNGIPHWEARGSESSMKIVLFDVADEVFDEMPYPDNEDRNSNIDVLGVHRGHLCMFRFFGSCFEQVEIWVMDEYGIKESWNRKLRFASAVVVDSAIRFQPFWVLPSGETLVQRKIFVYDQNSEIVRDLSDSGVEEWSEIVDHVESLVKLEGA